MIYAIERLHDVLPDIKLLVPDHWREMEHHTDVREFDPDFATYLQAETMGCVALATVRDGGRLVGYVGCIVRSDPHARGQKMATAAAYFVERRPLRGLVLRTLIRTMLEHLKNLGVTWLRWTTVAHRSAGTILENLGFEAGEIVYTLVL